MTQTKEQKETLKAAQASAPSDDQLRDMAARLAPLERDEEHSYVPAEDTAEAELDTEDVQPNLTTDDSALETASKNITITRPDNAESTYERSTAFTEAELERLTDDQIKDAKVLSKATPLVSPARLGQSDRPRQPTFRTPAAGAGSWPLNESQMPAVLPSDPPVEAADSRDLGGNGFAKRAGFKSNKDGTLVRKGLRIEKNQVAQAAALHASLRQQFPHFTSDQLADEFEAQWLSLRSGAEQSHRAGPELSPHGQTAVGDARVKDVAFGKLRSETYEADPDTAPPAPETVPSTGLPSTNEPATTAPDMVKEDSGETAEADEKAKAEFAKFDHDNDGLPGGSKPAGS